MLRSHNQLNTLQGVGIIIIPGRWWNVTPSFCACFNSHAHHLRGFFTNCCLLGKDIKPWGFGKKLLVMNVSTLSVISKKGTSDSHWLCPASQVKSNRGLCFFSTVLGEEDFGGSFTCGPWLKIKWALSQGRRKVLWRASLWNEMESLLTGISGAASKKRKKHAGQALLCRNYTLKRGDRYHRWQEGSVWHRGDMEWGRSRMRCKERWGFI